MLHSELALKVLVGHLKAIGGYSFRLRVGTSWSGLASYSLADPDLVLRGKGRSGFVLLALAVFSPFCDFVFLLPKIRGGCGPLPQILHCSLH